MAAHAVVNEAAMAINAIPKFVARETFQVPSNLPKTYYLGHHDKGLRKMKELVSSSSVIIECRDCRIPLTARNAHLERSLGLLGGDPANRPKRIIVFTKEDLAFPLPSRSRPEQFYATKKEEDILRNLHRPDKVSFSSTASREDTSRSSQLAKKIRSVIREHCQENYSLTGHKVLIAGLPNAGKSTLLNALLSVAPRPEGKGMKKRSRSIMRTGSEAGVTRSVSNQVVLISPEEMEKTNAFSSASSQESSGMPGLRSETVYIHDTPGVFAPYIRSSMEMLKLALCGCVREGLVAPLTLMDYILFRINQIDPSVYAKYSPPTNNVDQLAFKIAEGTGRKGNRNRGGEPDPEAAAIWFVQQWRNGKFARFMVDDLSRETNKRDGDDDANEMSWNQARRLYKAQRLENASRQRQQH